MSAFKDDCDTRLLFTTYKGLQTIISNYTEEELKGYYKTLRAAVFNRLKVEGGVQFLIDKLQTHEDEDEDEDEDDSSVHTIPAYPDTIKSMSDTTYKDQYYAKSAQIAENETSVAKFLAGIMSEDFLQNDIRGFFEESKYIFSNNTTVCVKTQPMATDIIKNMLIQYIYDGVIKISARVQGMELLHIVHPEWQDIGGWKRVIAHDIMNRRRGGAKKKCVRKSAKKSRKPKRKSGRKSRKH